MTAIDVAGAMEIAAKLQEAPHWLEAAYLRALDPGTIPRRIAMVVSSVQTAELCGFAIASVIRPQAELETIVVAPQSQRQGAGRLLFHALAAELRAAGVSHLFLEVRTSNRSALGFYGALGFSRIGLRRGYYTDPMDDAALMELRLG